ncbi:MAG: penicillin-binding protein activator [Candidatus Zixiibacteriota bacterium]|nr:MAG: penicillin-binding protein activator [candidate division Zixibacteria bacterium]
MAKRKISSTAGWLLAALLLACPASWSQVIYPYELERNLKEAEKSYSEKDFLKAEDLFLRLSKSFPGNPRYSYFQLMIAKCEYHLGEYSSAGGKFKRFIRQFPRSNYLPACYLMLGNIAHLEGKPYQSAENLIHAYQFAGEERSKTLARKSVEPVLERWLSVKELDKLSKANRDKDLAPFIFFHLGRRSLEQGKHKKALEALNYYLENFPQGENVQEVHLLLQKASSSTPRTVKVGVLAPLSGEFSVYGKSLISGMRLALSPEPSTRGKVELAVKDTQGESAQEAQLCHDLIEEDEVVCVIGPLRSESVERAAVVAELSKIPLITPTASRKDLAGLGDFVFQLSPTPHKKGQIVAEFAVQDQGLRDFAMLVPEGEPETSEVSGFKATVEKLGGRVVAMEQYPAGTQDFSPHLKGIKNVLLGFPSAPPSQEKDSFFDEVPVWLEGLFISADQKEMYDILSRIHNLNIFGTILGTEVCGDPQVWGFARNIDREMVFASNRFADGSHNQRRQYFSSLYRERHSREPDLVSMLGYDSMLLLLSVLENARSPQGIKDALLAISAFEGAAGEIGFDPNGENTRTPIYKLEKREVKRVR